MEQQQKQYMGNNQQPILFSVDQQLSQLLGNLDDMQKSLKKFKDPNLPHLQNAAINFNRNLQVLSNFTQGNQETLDRLPLPFGLDQQPMLPANANGNINILQGKNIRDIADDMLQPLQYYNQLARGKKVSLTQFKEEMERIMVAENLRIEEPQILQPEMPNGMEDERMEIGDDNGLMYNGDTDIFNNMSLDL